MLPLSPTDLTLSSTSTWEDVDVSAHIPTDATGVVIRVKSVGGGR